MSRVKTKGIIRIFSIVALLISIAACTTQKKSGELTGLGKFYHNTTAYYNAYFNANEIMEESLESLNSNYQDNYNQVLPVYEYVAVDDVGGAKGDMDRIIEKMSVDISLHRRSDWEDDCYLMIGRAQYVKKDYESAEKTIEFLLDNFDPDNPRDFKPEKAETKRDREKQRQAELRRQDEERRAREAERLAEIEAREKAREEERKKRERERKEQEEARKEEKKQREKEREAEVEKRRQSVEERKKEREALEKARREYNKEVKKIRAKNAKRRKKGKKPLPLPPRPGSKTSSKASAEDSKSADNAKKANESDKSSESGSERIEKEGKSDVDNSKKNDDAGIPDEKKEPEDNEPSRDAEDKEIDPVEDKKDDKNKDGGLFKHQSAYPAALLWMARVYTERDRYDRARSMFARLDEYGYIPDDILRELYPAKAHFYLSNKQPGLAIEPLKKAVEVAKPRTLRARYAFILGQLLQQEGAFKEANEYYDMARKWTNDYEMAFTARMKIATSGLAAGTSTREESMRLLDKMLNDDKNREYKDRIYFEMARIALQQGNETEAVRFLKKSLQFKSGNNAQAAEAYVTLANIYYDNKEYIKAKLYYDSTQQVMSTSDPRLLVAKERSTTLTDIVENLVVLNENDTLLMLGNMDEADKKAYAAELLSEQLEEEMIEERKKVANQQRQLNFSPPTATSANAASNFFAYDERVLRKGYREFEKKWGDRALTDDWRRSSIAIDPNSDAALEEPVIEAEEVTQKDIKDVMKGVPASEQEFAAIKSRIEDALYGLGVGFRERLDDYGSSLEYLLRLEDEFPQSDKLPETYYYIYLNYLDSGNQSKAQEYYDKLQKSYPESIYAMVLKDPAYAAKLSAEERKVANYYNETFFSFEKGDHEDVIRRVSQAENMFDGEDPFMPKFALLRAMSEGSVNGKEAYIEALKDMIANYRGTPEEVRAKEIMRFLQGDDRAFQRIGPVTDMEMSKYRVDNDKLHYVIAVLYNQNEVSLGDSKDAVRIFNDKEFKGRNLRLTNIYLDTESKIPVLVIRKFNNRDQAMEYYQSAMRNKNAFMPLGADFELFAVTQRNYREVIKSHSTTAYAQFFNEHYLK